MTDDEMGGVDTMTGEDVDDEQWKFKSGCFIFFAGGIHGTAVSIVDRTRKLWEF
jgi:hypothetical protein